MKKRSLTLLLTAALGLASAQSATATPDARLSAASVTVQMGQYSGPLSSMLAAVAKAAGYEVVFDFDIDKGGATTATTQAGQATPDAPKPLDFASKPFNQVWPFIMDLYGLSYQVTGIGGKDVIRVTNSPIQTVINLKNANAADAETRVKLFFGTPVYSETQVKDAAGNVTATTRSITDVKLDSTTLRIVADPRTNSLIVRGTNREIADVQKLAAEIDKAASGPRTVYTVKGSIDDVKGVLAQQYPTIQVTSTGKGNQVILAGPSDATTAAIALLGQVDQPVQNGPAIVQKTFTLANARATEVKKTLDGTLATALTQTPTPVNVPITATDANGNPTTVTVPNTTATAQAQQQAQTAAATPSSNGATIIADERTNTLIVRGTQIQVDQVTALIPQLDVRVPVVNVQVRIQEITESASRSLGIDWNVGFGNFVTKLVSGNLTGLFDATTSLAGGLNIGATLKALEGQGLTKRVYDGSVTMQSGQRATGNAGGAANASSTAAATLKSGGRLELTIPSSAGNIIRQIDYGVNLNFLNPQVAPDGTITLGVDSSVSQPKTAITGGTLPNLLDFTNSQAQTTISFKSGQTVMLGGLLGTNETTTKNGVPFLSSLPLIGPLFSTTDTRKDQTQLLIIITGNIVN